MKKIMYQCYCGGNKVKSKNNQVPNKHFSCISFINVSIYYIDVGC